MRTATSRSRSARRPGQPSGLRRGDPGVPFVDALDLADWRRRVWALYEPVRSLEARAARDAQSRALAAFRAGRDVLFREHPQSPIPPDERASFGGCRYYPLDPALRFACDLVADGARERVELPMSRDAGLRFQPLGHVVVPLPGGGVSLTVYWLDDYAGGLFLPFRDGTAGLETYAAGRYLWDSAKGADLGLHDGRLIVDFNYAYNPSCAYDPRWACPLAPPVNRLAVPIRAGERAPMGPPR